MRYFALVLLLIFLCIGEDKSFGIEKPKLIPELVIEANILRSYDTLITYLDTMKHKAFEIKLSIVNKSKKPISFWMMTCSWKQNFVINNDYIKFMAWDCDRNFPTTKQLNPNDRLDLKTSVLKYDFTLYQEIKTTKFGLIFIDSSVYKNMDDYELIIGDKSKQDQIIWSNALYLND